MEEVNVDVEVNELEEVLESIRSLRPERSIGHYFKGGSGMVRDSFFTFKHHGHYYWVVFVCGLETFAYKRITPEWIELYSNLILLSPEVFVVWDKEHKIIEWAVEQDKVCEFPVKKNMTRAT
ncbi:MAG: hypothetical protein A4E52_00293 [Pelotomaculum sp. PtaB.Bin013]|uniref:Uncharacterized protein n=1 Tax=Pelotomaculum isophthalicicum JI TaxID=947010 RepID=A0A9X4JU01_9FIRM|nr:hypothetical protein [Pelotomaculum isophthalicicum]MDF9408260.1 hypothetical protein [Pelotomaculum isophthalicicum JI]OPX91859.1 MAG: hypothetical protein A4E52_00293 [Pelotomaculum sp. PtaB.Bin013]